MTADDGVTGAFLVLALVLPLSALIARRIPVGAALRMALAWVAIFAIGLILVGQRDRIGGLFDGARRALVGDDQTVVGETVRIAMAPDGHFWATARVNGIERRMLIDSGATVTAISARTAKAAAVSADGAFPAAIETANGPVMADRATIASLSIGRVVARDLPVVVADAFGDTDVIGMNFLSRLRRWRVEGRTLILEPNPV